MSRNPYVVLGLSPSAGDAEIRTAFRQLAKKYHPDRNPGNKQAEEKFKEISAAFDIIGDPERRKKFDRGEIGEDGRERASPFHQWSERSGYAGSAGGGFGGQAGGPGANASFDDLGDIFSDLFSSGARRPGAGRQQKGSDIRYRIDVDFLDAASGAKRRVTMPDGRALDLVIPAGVDDGQTLRLRGQGERGPAGPGDVYVEVTVKSHSVFERKGDDIYVDAPITLKEAVLGGKITIPTISGDVSVSIPKNSSSGTTLRLRGRGIARLKSDRAGDQFVKLAIMLPEDGDAALEAFVRGWQVEDEDTTEHFAGA